MAANTIAYLPATTRLLSGNLWGLCPVAELKNHELDGFFFFDDFTNCPTLSPASNTGLYASYIDTGNTILPMPTEKGGVVELLTDATDNDEVWITTCGNTGTMCGISETAGNAYNQRLWFECRFKVQNIANSQKNIYIGLSEEARAVADTITDAGVLGDFDFVGFNQPEADGDGIDAVWQKATAALQVKIADYGVPVADTYMKLGFFYDPLADAANRISFYKNNVKSATYGTNANLTASTFPGGEELALLAGLKNGTGAAHKFQIDWWACAQMQ